MSKDIVFFSNFCDYSKEVVQKINNTPLKDQITLVCVDDKNIQLPDFIQAVPTVFLINEKKILIDDDIETWFNSKTNSNHSQGQGSGDDLTPYFGSAGAFSSSFSNLDDSPDKPFISGFTYLDEPSSAIQTPDKLGNDDRIKSDITQSFEKLQQARNQEMSQNPGMQRI